MQVNNKLREAMMQIYDRVNSLDENCGVDPVEIRDIARAALAEPVKNCEVGTDDEQALRFVEFCGKHHTAQGRWICHECPCKGNMNEIPHCLTKWAQMPYEEEGGNR